MTLIAAQLRLLYSFLHTQNVVESKRARAPSDKVGVFHKPSLGGDYHTGE